MATEDFTVTPEMVDEIDAWHARRPDDRVSRPLIPHLRQRFGIDNAQALAIITEANLRHRRAE